LRYSFGIFQRETLILEKFGISGETSNVEKFGISGGNLKCRKIWNFEGKPQI